MTPDLEALEKAAKAVIAASASHDSERTEKSWLALESAKENFHEVNDAPSCFSLTSAHRAAMEKVN
ncbi:MAG: hypothetical protein KGP14_13385, partial [Betaproteobacteria bacterium]|nr:hypothetical protein [Betaproteobacteria bacterium]